MKVPEDVGLNCVQSVSFGFGKQILPHCWSASRVVDAAGDEKHSLVIDNNTAIIISNTVALTERQERNKKPYNKHTDSAIARIFINFPDLTVLH